MAKPFSIGDVVRLKSGGPSMTVAEIGDIEGQPTVSCTWFENDKKEQGTFHPDTLRRRALLDLDTVR